MQIHKGEQVRPIPSCHFINISVIGEMNKNIFLNCVNYTNYPESALLQALAIAQTYILLHSASTL